MKRFLAFAIVALVPIVFFVAHAGAPPGKDFDHAKTSFPLVGAHEKVACESCHPAGAGGRQWKGIASDCHSCHGDRRNHKGALGAKCEACHDASAWSAIKYDAASHKLALTGKHKLDCVACHKAGAHLVASVTCADCHEQKHGGTKAACETCHSTASWRDTHYRHGFDWARLPGKHAAAACLSCHPSYRFNGTSFNCESCHRKDQKHDDLGACAPCHTALQWKPATFDHGARSVGFALDGKHASVACAKCHTPTGVYRAAPRACEGCHASPPHGNLGGCAQCHSSATFAKTGFDHDKTRFPLDEKHRTVACKVCHDKATPGTFVPGRHACESCHSDVHERQFPDGSDARHSRPCNDCHVSRAWKPSIVDASMHARFGYPLNGAHATAACDKCHLAGKFVGTARDCRACHVDRHHGMLGPNCASCHAETSWKEHASFDHGARTGFVLEGTHARTACVECHGESDAKMKAIERPISCTSCHRPKHEDVYGNDCRGCHPITTWSDGRSFDHNAKTLFPLERRHKAIACASCHDPKARRPDRNCVTCHDDPHAGRTFQDCAECHRPDNWLVVKYDHDRAEFPLKGKHFFTPCRDCHTNDVWTGLRRECVSCHRGDEQYANMRHADHAAKSWDCIDCHRPWDWHFLVGK